MKVKDFSGKVVARIDGDSAEELAADLWMVLNGEKWISGALPPVYMEHARTLIESGWRK
jgi:hypothetical protein